MLCALGLSLPSCRYLPVVTFLLQSFQGIAANPDCDMVAWFAMDASVLSCFLPAKVFPLSAHASVL